MGIGILKQGAWIYPKSNGREVESRLADGTHIAESSLGCWAQVILQKQERRLVGR